MDTYDIAIIGAGQAGVPLAHDLARAGRRTILIERKHLGGSCVNFGCTPTKAAIASARLAHLARRGADFGLRIPSVEVDFAAVIDRARKIAEGHRDGLGRGFEGKENPKLLRAQARLEGRDGDRFRIVAGETTIAASQVVLDTGTRSAIAPIKGLDQVPFIHAGNWLARRELPQRLIVIGGGVIALEMAQFYGRMGSSVVVIEAMGQIAGTEDPDVAVALQDILEREGIEFHLETKIEGVSRRGSAVCVDLAGGQEIAGTDLFLATGRKPNTDDLGLESVGIETNKGIVKVDEHLATSVAGIWAAGDIRGGPMFTHTAWDDYRVLKSQIAGDKTRTTDRVVPYAIFTDPEIGRVGMNEAQAKKSGVTFDVKRFEIRRNSNAEERGETDGFIKVLVDRHTERMLGATVFCTEAAELVHIYIDLMNGRAPIAQIREAVYIHPTLAEAIQSAVS